jgi:hypothetical protein
MNALTVSSRPAVRVTLTMGTVLLSVVDLPDGEDE